MTRLLPFVVAAALSSGCYTMNAQMPGTLRQDVKPDQIEKVGTLNYETKHWYFLMGLIGTPEEDVFATEIKKQVSARGADGVSNLRYEAQEGCFDLFITGITLTCIAPRTYIVSGDIVRIKTAPLPGKSAKNASVPATGGTKPPVDQMPPPAAY